MAGRFSVEAVFKAVDRVTAPVSRMQNRIGKFARSAERSLRRVTRMTGKLVGGLGRIAKRAAFAGGILAGGFVLALNNVADQADALNKTARRLAFPVEELQEWRFVAEQSGVETKLLESSLGAFTKRLGEARAGSGALVTLLKKTNPQFLRQITAVEDTSEAFEMYLNFIRQAETATDKAARASAGFSRAGLKLINITDNSSAAIRALREEQRRNGVITEEQAAAAEAYNDAVNSLKKSLFGLLQASLLPILPVITETVKGWRELAVANREAISERVVAFLRRLWGRLQDLVAAAVEFNRKYDLAERIGEGFTTLAKFGEFMKENGGLILKAAGAVVALVAVLNVLAGVFAVVNAVMALNPIGLIVLGVAALIAGFTALVVWIDDVVAGFEKLPGVIKLALAPIRALLHGIKFVKDAVQGGLGFAFDEFKASFSNDDEEDAGDGGGFRVVSPQERTARTIEESRQTSQTEVTIRDETGRAEISKQKGVGGALILQHTGAF